VLPAPELDAVVNALAMAVVVGAPPMTPAKPMAEKKPSRHPCWFADISALIMLEAKEGTVLDRTACAAADAMTTLNCVGMPLDMVQILQGLMPCPMPKSTVDRGAAGCVELVAQASGSARRDMIANAGSICVTLVCPRFAIPLYFAQMDPNKCEVTIRSEWEYGKQLVVGIQ
jgi:hypothetical protein